MDESSRKLRYFQFKIHHKFEEKEIEIFYFLEQIRKNDRQTKIRQLMEKKYFYFFSFYCRLLFNQNALTMNMKYMERIKFLSESMRIDSKIK